MRAILLITFLFWAIPALAQNVLFHTGINIESGERHSHDAWNIEYNEALSEYIYYSLGWYNEGHLDGHHRDGPVAQIGYRVRLIDQRLSLSFAAGPYAYYDTASVEQDSSYTNDHGIGMIFSGGVGWYTSHPWFFHLRLSRIETNSSFDSDRLSIGIGYQLESPHTPGMPASPARQTTSSEFTVFVGGTVLNSFESEDSLSTAVEYRLGIGQNVDWTLGLLHEGGNHIISRDGITTQLWLVRAFMHDKLTLGAGGGAYFAISEDFQGNGAIEESKHLLGIVTLTSSYRFADHWLARFSWNRIFTDYNRDTDVFLLGCGYRF